MQIKLVEVIKTKLERHVAGPIGLPNIRMNAEWGKDELRRPDYAEFHSNVEVFTRQVARTSDAARVQEQAKILLLRHIYGDILAELWALQEELYGEGFSHGPAFKRLNEMIAYLSRGTAE